MCQAASRRAASNIRRHLFTRRNCCPARHAPSFTTSTGAPCGRSRAFESVDRPLGKISPHANVCNRRYYTALVAADATSSNGRDFSSIPTWVASSDFGKNGGQGAVGPLRWASLFMRPNNDDAELERLQATLAGIDKDTEVLEITNSTPSNEQWRVLGQHFRNVRRLHVEAGWEEKWFDEEFPLHWPLDTLIISSSSGHLVTTPAILEGRVRHLVLLLTSGLRFEGPTNKELMDDRYKCEEEQRWSKRSPAQSSSGRRININFVYMPGRIRRWLEDKYEALEQWPPAETHLGDHSESQLKALDIVENDAIDTFQRLALSHSSLVLGLEKLSLRSTNGCDFKLTPDGAFPYLLSRLPNLKHLELNLIDVFSAPETILHLLHAFPKNLESLKFSGPPSLAEDENFRDWIEAFGNKDYLPRLKNLSFVLDATKKASEPTSASAAAGAANVLRAARARGVQTREFHDEWDDVPWFQRFRTDS